MFSQIFAAPGMDKALSAGVGTLSLVFFFFSLVLGSLSFRLCNIRLKDSSGRKNAHCTMTAFPTKVFFFFFFLLLEKRPLSACDQTLHRSEGSSFASSLFVFPVLL